MDPEAASRQRAAGCCPLLETKFPELKAASQSGDGLGERPLVSGWGKRRAALGNSGTAVQLDPSGRRRPQTWRSRDMELHEHESTVAGCGVPHRCRCPSWSAPLRPRLNSRGQRRSGRVQLSSNPAEDGAHNLWREPITLLFSRLGESCTNLVLKATVTRAHRRPHCGALRGPSSVPTATLLRLPRQFSVCAAPEHRQPHMS